MMAHEPDYTAGWIHTNIHDLLAEIAEPTSSMTYALITCLDSNFEVTSLFKKSRHLESLREKFEPVGKGALVTTRQLLAAQRRDRIFFGFDEIWFFPNSGITPKPRDFIITGPRRIDAQQIDRHAAWLTTNHCSMGLGDGSGMNYCLRVRGAAKYIIQASNEANSHTQEDREIA
jgi:hypothetical protein